MTISSNKFDLKPSLTKGSRILHEDAGVWKFEIPAGNRRKYHLAQWDDVCGLPRNQLIWRPPAQLRVRARTSVESIPGTFGFGWWNDPFGMGILSGLQGVRLPVMPQAVWFFYASLKSHLALQENLPANGWMASVFKSTGGSLAALSIGAAFLPGVFSKRLAQRAIRYAGRNVSHEAAAIDINITEWHSYQIDWLPERAAFVVDGEPVLKTKTAPSGPLGFVLWIDNQYAAILPSGELKYGWQAVVDPVYLEISDLNFK